MLEIIEEYLRATFPNESEDMIQSLAFAMFHDSDCYLQFLSTDTAS